MKRPSSLTFKDLSDSAFGSFTRVVWNGKTVYEDLDDGLHIDNNWDPVINVEEETQKFLDKYSNKIIYNFYCRIGDFHHTELYIEGEE